MAPRFTNATRKWFLIAAGVVALWAAGSWAYWVGSGSPGTPAEFRRDVADTGLVVVWVANGPTGGTGVVETSCGPADVEINDFDDALRIRWDGNDEAVTADVIEKLTACMRP